MFKNKIILISGGTGSFGHAVIKRFLDSEIQEIRIFSRDEKKQDDLRKKYNNKKLKFYIGDVRDYDSISAAVLGTDFIFHAAALKQVPSCEFFPMEAFKTNVLGADNVITAAINHKIKKVICLSTDKAVYPINAMGLSKAMMEKIAISKSRLSSDTKILITRYGNVMASRGSVIPLFVEKVILGHPLLITDAKMTRFMMTLDDAVNLVMYAFEYGESGDIFVQKAPAATIEILAKAILKVISKSNHPIEIIGTRHGEKLYESLLSREEVSVAEDLGSYYRIPPDLRDLNYSKFVDQGEKNISNFEDYNSHNTERLDLESMVNLLQKLPFIQQILGGEKPMFDN
jgi:UDP-N-acetylglucosamine 4,6-dehydratase